MKITFEGQDIADIIDQLSVFIADVVLKVREYADDPEPVQAPVKNEVKEVLQKIEQRLPADIAAVDARLREPWPAPKKPAEKPAEQKRVRSEKQLANDERMRAAALERIAVKKAAKAQREGYATTLRKDLARDPIEKVVSYDTKAEEPAAEPEVFADPAEAVRIRQKTIEDLQQAYANGHQQEVFELLSRFGNGAKSFRELPPEAFTPIRDAIDKGALT